MNALFGESTVNPYAPHAREDAAPQASAQEARAGADPSPSADIFRYEDYRGFLRDRFTDIQSRDPRFSQRGLARKAGIANPGFFNEVIKGRRRLSPAAAVKMSAGLALSPEESEYFSALVEYAETREPRGKLAAGQRMLWLRNRKRMSLLGDHSAAPAESLGEIYGS